LGKSLTNQNSIQEEIKRRLKSKNACYFSVQNLLPSSLLSQNKQLKIYRTIIKFLTLKEESRMGVFKNRGMRKIFGPKRDEAKESGENYIMRSILICTAHAIISG
jgi:hypothetical protein